MSRSYYLLEMQRGSAKCNMQILHALLANSITPNESWRVYAIAMQEQNRQRFQRIAQQMELRD